MKLHQLSITLSAFERFGAQMMQLTANIRLLIPKMDVGLSLHLLLVYLTPDLGNLNYCCRSHRGNNDPLKQARAQFLALPGCESRNVQSC